MIYTNVVSGAFQTISYTNLLRMWVDDLSAPHAKWTEALATDAILRAAGYNAPTNPLSVELQLIVMPFGGLIGTSWAAACIYVPPDGIHLLPFSAQRIEDAKAARQSIEEFGALTENWDGYGASPISNRARWHALRFIDVIEAAPSRLPVPEISPVPSGTIAFEWETSETVAYLEIGDTSFSGYIRLGRQLPTYLQGQADSLDQQIVAVIQTALSGPVIPSQSITEIHTQVPQHELVAM